MTFDKFSLSNTVVWVHVESMLWIIIENFITQWVHRRKVCKNDLPTVFISNRQNFPVFFLIVRFFGLLDTLFTDRIFSWGHSNVKNFVLICVLSRVSWFNDELSISIHDSWFMTWPMIRCAMNHGWIMVGNPWPENLGLWLWHSTTLKLKS